MPPAFKPPYAVPVPGATAKEGETVPYRHFKFADKLIDHPENMTTLWDMFLHGYKLADGQDFMGTRRMENGVAKEYVWQTYPQVRERIENYGRGLVSLGLKRQESLGIYSVNRPEWVKNKKRYLTNLLLTCFIDHV
jgi:long-chain acyl-CoA synthetase